MAGNTWGQLFKVTTFGESHGAGIGVVIDGCPAGLEISREEIQLELDRRKPGQSAIVTQRKEADQVEILSGIFEGQTTGTPIGMFIRNADQKSRDYDHIKDKYRPSHADYTYDAKYGIRDYRGGGRSSARETAARVAAGAVAKKLLVHYDIAVHAYVQRAGDVEIPNTYTFNDPATIEHSPTRCPDAATAAKMEQYLKDIRKAGDTVGGSIKTVVWNCPAGLGEPAFDKLHADLGKAMLSINAAQAFEYGSGWKGTYSKGSENNDAYSTDETGKVITETNQSGGVQGGISNGMEIYFQVGFKPIATLMRDQQSVNDKGEAVTVQGKGRHDPCVLPRAVPIVEAMTALVLADHHLRARSNRL